MSALAEHVPAPAALSPFRGLDLCEAAGFTLAHGGSGPVFEDDVWDFNAVVGRPKYLAPGAFRLEFTAIADPRWRVVAKEYVAALMLPRHERVHIIAGAYRLPRTVYTCKLKLRALARWLGWLTGQRIGSLGEVTDEMCRRHLAEVTRHVDKKGAVVRVSKGLGIQVVTVISELAAYRELFSTDRYPVGLAPFGGKAGSLIMGVKQAGENTTPPVASEVLQPSLAAALYFTEILAPHILAELLAMREAQRVDSARLCRRSEPDFERLRGVIRAHVEQARPLPAVTSAGLRTVRNRMLRPDDPLAAVALSPIAREAGLYYFRMAWLEHVRDDLEAALEQVGAQPPWARCAPSVERADGGGQVPWSVPLETVDLMKLGSLLRTACVLVLGATTGMRWSEQMELVHGCRLPPVAYGPGLARYKIASRIVKGKPLGGELDEWVVLKQAYDAIGILEELAGETTQPDTPLLRRYSPSSGFPDFRGWISSPAGARLGLAPIPDGPLHPRALRRTLAIELAYRPGGLWAAKLHLKHVSVVTTEGYAARPGGAQGRFMAEVAAHEQQHRCEIVGEEYARFTNGVMPSGPGAAGLIEFFATVDGKLAEQASMAPNVSLSDRAVQTLMAKKAKTLHLGQANYCWYEDPGKALCQILARRHAAAIEIDGPLLNLCDSARCPQATHSIAHRSVWAQTVEQNTVFLGQISRGQKAERMRLEADLARARRVIEEIDRAAGGLRENDHDEDGE